MWPALAALGGAYLGYKGTKSQNVASAQQAERQMDFQERMSRTAHQRQVADMRAAGLNPILSATGGKGASTPVGAQAPQYNKYQVALQNASTAATINNIVAQTAKTEAETKALGWRKDLGSWIDWLIPDVNPDEEPKGGSSAKSLDSFLENAKERQRRINSNAIKKKTIDPELKRMRQINNKLRGKNANKPPIYYLTGEMIRD